jgi:NADH-quinone oxidoreductase subunit N
MTAPLLAAATGHLALPRIDYYSILPELVLLGGALVALVVSSLVRRALRPSATTGLAVSAGLASLALSLVQWYQVSGHGPHVAIAGAVVEDGFSALVSVLVSCAVVLSAMVMDGWTRREEVMGPELQVLMLVSASGAMIMGSANDLVVVFLGLEIMSIALYVLAALNPRRAESAEASLKYFVLGAFSSAVFAYGIALVYGATGTSNLPQIADYLARNAMLHNGLLLAGLAFLLVGFGFKVAAVPFHLWTPDVYQGAPSPVTGFMAAIAKAGGFAALLRVFISSFGLLRSDWQPAVWVMAAITLVLGAVLALVQSDIKRMLAYSSISHAGFVLLGLQAATARGVESSLYYLFVYMFMVIGSFAVVTVVGGPGDSSHDLDRYRGLAATRPLLAGSFAVLLMAQAGIPFTTGFWAKLEAISAAVGAGSTALAVVAMVSAAVAAFFYLRVILYMYTPAGDALAGVPAGAAAPSSGSGEAGASLPVGVGVTRGELGSLSAGGLSAGGLSAGGLSEGDLSVGVSSGSVQGATSSHGVPEQDVLGEASGNEVDMVGGRSGMVGDLVRGPADGDALRLPGGVSPAIALCVAVTILFGVWPAPLLDFAHRAALLFIPH